MYYILLIIPTVVYVSVWFYNHKNPMFFGIPFFYWFQIVFLVFTSIFYVLAVISSKND